LRDHLGSTSVTADPKRGQVLTELRYLPWGEIRYTSGDTATDRKYTGQAEASGIGLYFYNARWYDPALGRFAQADIMVPNPGNPMSFDRYSYVMNNPIKYIDPSGHETVLCDAQCEQEEDDKFLSVFLRSHPLEEWEIQMLTLVVFKETNRGNYPDEWMAMIAWTYLNRLSLGTHDSLWLAVKGDQSALQFYYQDHKVGDNKVGPEYRYLETNPSDAALEVYMTELYQWVSQNYAGLLAHVRDIVNKAVTDWTNYGTYSPSDPTGGATDFRMARPETYRYNYGAWLHPSAYPRKYPGFGAQVLGLNEEGRGIEIPTLEGMWVMLLSNILYISTIYP
jgi:RHS repeat-associated protein